MFRIISFFAAENTIGADMYQPAFVFLAQMCYLMGKKRIYADCGKGIVGSRQLLDYPDAINDDIRPDVGEQFPERFRADGIDILEYPVAMIRIKTWFNTPDRSGRTEYGKFPVCRQPVKQLVAQHAGDAQNQYFFFIRFFHRFL